jgi:hypothetical protein
LINCLETIRYRINGAKDGVSQFSTLSLVSARMIVAIPAILALFRLSFLNSAKEPFDTLKRKFEHRMKLARRNVPRALLLMIASLGLGACAQPAVRPFIRTGENGLPRPARIIIYDFAASEIEVVEYQGVFRQQPSNPNPTERRRAIARNVSDALSLEFARALQELGFSVERGVRGTTDADDILIIEGEFIRIDEGSPLRRWVVGFGSGAARVQTRVRVYQGPRQKKLLEFSTDADSGKMPGAAVTVSAGAAAPMIVSAGLFTGSALATGFQNRSDVSQLAQSSADQAVRYLSEFFARQGWIRPDQVKKARIAY